MGTCNGALSHESEKHTQRQDKEQHFTNEIKNLERH